MAAQVGVTPNTLWRWEKSGKGPVKPRKRVCDGGIVYSQDDVTRLKAWAASGTDARQRQDREDGPDPKGDGPTLEEGDAPPPPGGLNA